MAKTHKREEIDSSEDVDTFLEPPIPGILCLWHSTKWDTNEKNATKNIDAHVW